MANITLRIDDELLEKARTLAFKKCTSINALVKQTLQEFVSRNLEREATIKGLESFFQRSRAVVGKRTWNRDGIHER